MKKFIHLKSVLITTSIILLTLIILLYIRSKADYPVAIMGSFTNSDKYIVMLDMNKKTIIKTGIKFKLDNEINSAVVSINKRQLVYNKYIRTTGLNDVFVKNLQTGKTNKIIKHDESSYIRNIKWVDENTLLYYEGNNLYTLDVKSWKSNAVKLPDTSIKLAAIYYPRNKGFIICTNNQYKWNSDISYNNFESDLYLVDSKGGNEKLLKKFKDFYIVSMKLMPGSEGLLISAMNHPADNQSFKVNVYLYNIKNGRLKLVLKHENQREVSDELSAYTNIFPYNRNNFIFQHEYKLYNVNTETGKMEKFNFKNQKPDEFFYSFTGTE